MPKGLPKSKDVLIGAMIAGLGFIGALLVMRQFPSAPILSDARQELGGS